MNEARERRKAQLNILLKTVSGKERIQDSYRRVCQPHCNGKAALSSFPDMIAAILDAEFPPHPAELHRV